MFSVCYYHNSDESQSWILSSCWDFFLMGPFGQDAAWRSIIAALIWVFLTNSSHYPCFGRGHCPKQSSGLICVICKPIDPIPQLKMSTVTDPLAASKAHSGVPLFSDPSPSINTTRLLPPASDGSILGPPSSTQLPLQSLSRQTSINGARWGDNEASRQRLTMVRNTQSSHCNTVMRDGHRRRVKRCPGLTSQRLLNEYLYLLNKGITCPDGVLANIHWEHHTHSPLWHKQPPTQRSGP